MMTTNSETAWTLMNTSITRTTRYGYSNTCTLADAMVNRQRMHCNNLADNFRSLSMAIGMSQTKRPARKAA